MSGRRGKAAWLAALLMPAALAGCDAGPADDGRCVMQEVADMTVLNDRGVAIVRVGVDGMPAAFVVDTGAASSMVTPEAADRFHLSVDTMRTGTVEGVGGSAFASPTTIQKMDLGTAAAHHVSLIVAGSFGHRTVDGLLLSGLFGSDFLANYDVEFDLPAHHVSLYREQACNAHFAQPWDGIAYRAAFDLGAHREIMLPATLNGAPIDLQLDSGATSTIVTPDTAAAAGVPAALLAADRTFTIGGVDGHRLVARDHHFASLVIGPDRLNGPWIAVADIQSNNLLGASFLRTHRVWISYPHEVMWVQPAGRVQLVGPQVHG